MIHLHVSYISMSYFDKKKNSIGMYYSKYKSEQ